MTFSKISATAGITEIGRQLFELFDSVTGVFIISSPILISVILLKLLRCCELNLLIKFHVFRGFVLAFSKFVVKYFCFAFLISLLV